MKFNKRSIGQKNRRAKEAFFKWFFSTWIGKLVVIFFWGFVILIAYSVFSGE